MLSLTAFPRPGRLAKYAALVIFVYILYASLSFSHTQSRFQQYLKSLYITWDDFPPAYAEALRTSKVDEAPLKEFDYSTFPTPPETTIPRIIHFIFFKNIYEPRPEITNIAAVGSEAPELCRAHNPSYTVNVWNTTAARELLEEHYAWFIPTYDAYHHPIQRVDAFKYFVLYHYGGIYSDLDIACRRPMDPLLPYPAWFPEASPLGVNNDLMASRKGHPLLEMMMHALKGRNLNLLFPYLTIFWSTGPQFTSDMLKRWFVQNRGHLPEVPSDKSTDPDTWYVLPQVFYSEEFTFFGHSPGGTWHGSDVAVVLWLVDRPWVPLLLLLSLIGLTITFYIRRRRAKKAAAVKEAESSSMLLSDYN